MSSPYKGRTGIDRLRHALRHSWDGLVAAFRGESAFRQELALAALLLPLAPVLGEGWVEVSLLAGTVVLVLLVELLNSAIEAVVDRISLEHHELSKRAKDFGSAAVLLALLLCSFTWAAALHARLTTPLP